MSANFQIQPQEVKNLSTLIADRLAESIQTGELKPGQRLVQTELAKQFGVSRVAIRDALLKLLTRGLALDIPLKGMIVQPVSYKTIHDLFAIRQALEPLAVKEACARLTRQDLQRIEALVKEQDELAKAGDIDGLLVKDQEFHETIYRCCDNEPLLEIISGLWARIRQARGLARINLSWGRTWATQSVKRHRKILLALKAKDAERAAELTVETIQLALAELAEGLEPKDKASGREAG